MWQSTCERIYICGDGVPDPGEGCDDGNEVADDGCTECEVDDGYACMLDENGASECRTCGDGWIDEVLGEECDTGTLLGNPTYGCSDTCTIRNVSPSRNCPTTDSSSA